MLMLVSILVSACCAEPTRLEQPTPAQVIALAEHFEKVWRHSKREQASLRTALQLLKESPPPSEPLDRLIHDVREIPNLQAYLRNQIEAHAELLKQMRSTLVPPLPPLISQALAPAKVGQMGSLNSVVRIVEVIDDVSGLVSVGEELPLARLHRSTRGMTVDAELRLGFTELFIVVGTEEYPGEEAPQRVLDLKQLNIAPIKAEVQKRMFPTPSESPKKSSELF